MRKLIVIVSCLFFCFSCSTKQVIVKSQQNLKKINPNIYIQITGSSVDNDFIKFLEKHLKVQFILEDFIISDTLENSIKLNVGIHKFEPGSFSARLIIGFGAGRGSFLYTATFIDNIGTVLAKLEGQEYFTGGEIHFNLDYGNTTTMGGAKTVEKILIQEAAKHIVECATNKI